MINIINLRSQITTNLIPIWLVLWIQQLNQSILARHVKVVNPILHLIGILGVQLICNYVFVMTVGLVGRNTEVWKSRMNLVKIFLKLTFINFNFRSLWFGRIGRFDFINTRISKSECSECFCHLIEIYLLF